MYLIDTNVLSELRRSKVRAPDLRVVSWMLSVSAGSTFLSVISMFEMERGVLSIERRDRAQGAVLRDWLDDVYTSFAVRVLLVDPDVAKRCAASHVPTTRPERDAWIAATALVHGMTVATRNVADFAPMDVAVFDPWTFWCCDRRAATISSVADGFQFAVAVPFEAARAEEVLRSVPAGPGVFALRGFRETDEPYLTRAADLRRRMRRLLDPPESQSKRLNLRERVARIEYTLTGSEFESALVLYEAAAALFGLAEARRRLRLHTPYFLRFTVENAHPRVYATNRLSRRGLPQIYGPFPSRAAAERYCDAALDLFKLRRCYEDLQPYPEHPGCVYQEMKKCLAPCNVTCTAEEYKAEAEAVEAFFRTRGESLLGKIAAEREIAAEAMEFEQAAALHERYQKVKAAASLADELVRPVLEVRAVVVQKAAPLQNERGELQEAAVFMVQTGCIAGPERMSTLGVRAVKEQTSVGSSLFAQPLMLQAVPLEGAEVGSAAEGAVNPETRSAEVLARLEAKAGVHSDVALLSDHLSLLRRWYYRPEKQRTGEIFFPYAEGGWPVRRILRGAARMALGEPAAMAETDREGAKKMRADAKVKVLHEGRPDVERIVPVFDPAQLPEDVAVFTSRRTRKA